MTTLRPYEFMPASIDTTDTALAVGIRYTKNSKYEVVKRPGYHEIRCPDRTLYLIRSAQPSFKRMLGVDLDEVVDLDVFGNKTLLSEMGYKYCMVNSSAVPKVYRHLDYDAEKAPAEPVVVSDSGGFQLNVGVQEFLEPSAIVEQHNRLCDVGIVLDIPLPHRFQQAFLSRAAIIQRKNTQAFLRLKRASLQLMNVVHGSTFYLREKFYHFVDKPEITRIALGGVKTLDILPLVLHILFFLEISQREYEQVHVLGVSGLERWIALSYIGHQKRTKLITSDSSSHIQCGVNLQYNVPQSIASVARNENGTFLQNSILQCSCPVCSTVKFSKALLDKDGLSSNVVISHNLRLYRHYIDDVWELTSLSKKEIIAYIRHQGSMARKLVSIKNALDCIDMAMQDGARKAAQRYAPHLLEKFIRSDKTGLFSSVDVASHDKKLYTRFEKVLSGYEKYHGIKTN